MAVVSHSSAPSSGRPMTTASAVSRALSATNKRALMRLKPKRFSMPKVRRSTKGRSNNQPSTPSEASRAVPWAMLPGANTTLQAS